jgi:hypothetical protein
MKRRCGCLGPLSDLDRVRVQALRASGSQGKFTWQQAASEADSELDDVQLVTEGMSFRSPHLPPLPPLVLAEMSWDPDWDSEALINTVQENFDKRDKKKAQITFPLRHFFPLMVVK